MKPERALSGTGRAELEELRGRLHSRFGMHSTLAFAYHDRDLDMFHSFDQFLHADSADTRPEDIYRAVLLLRESSGVNEVSSMVTEAHIGVEADFYRLIRTAQLMSTAAHSPEATRQVIHQSVIFAYRNMHLIQHIETAMKLHLTDPQEIHDMALSLAESSPALLEGSL